MAEIATRKAYGEAIVKMAETEDIIVLDADLAAATQTGMFKKAYPDRFFNCGIAEANMMGVAAGLATCGKTVFCSTFAMFAAGRAYEQVRNSIGYPHLPVNIAATHAGISVGEDGATHQCCEDIALMRTIPGMTVVNPCDGVQTRALINAVAKVNGPTYTRLCRLATPDLYEEGETFELGKAKQLRDGKDLTIIACGLMVHEAVAAADELTKEGVSVRVLDMHTIKPLDEEAVIKAAKETGRIITAEEHSVIGGLGAAVCECLAENHPCKVRRIGVKDTFGKSGPARKVLALYGLTAENIVATAKEMLD